MCIDGDHVIVLTLAAKVVGGVRQVSDGCVFLQSACAFDVARITLERATFACDRDKKTRCEKYSQCFYYIVHLKTVNPLSLNDEETFCRPRRFFTVFCGRFKDLSGLIKVRLKVCVVR